MESEPEPSSPPSLLPSLTTKDELEGIEVAEFDANALWELLQDEPKEEEKAPMETIHLNPDTSAFESDWSLNENNDDMVDWFRMMEETSIACSEMGGWCMEEMSQILEIRDYSFSYSHTPILSDEIGYIGGLWHE